MTVKSPADSYRWGIYEKALPPKCGWPAKLAGAAKLAGEEELAETAKPAETAKLAGSPAQQSKSVS